MTAFECNYVSEKKALNFQNEDEKRAYKNRLFRKPHSRTLTHYVYKQKKNKPTYLKLFSLE